MTNIKQLLKRAGYALAVLAVVAAPLIGVTQASAAQITARKVTIDSSLPSASTAYKFDFTIPTTASIGSIKFEFCDAASGTCNSSAATTGVVTSATLTAQSGTGATGFTLGSNTSNSSYITRTASSISATTAVSYTLSGITNPSNSSATVFFVRISTYTGTNGSTGLTDSGTVATSTAGLVTVNATVDETLTFTLAAQTVSLSPSPIGTGAASFGTSTMAASTNASSGYTITYSSPNSLQPVGGGTALTAYTNAAATPGTPGFGINIVDNATPNVGANPSGGSGTAQGLYANVDAFTFVASTPTLIAQSTVATNTTSYTVSYVANIDALTAPGAYTTNFTYVATPNF